MSRCGRVRNDPNLWTGGTVGMTLRVPDSWRYAWWSGIGDGLEEIWVPMEWIQWV
ncbi:MAG: hypothetical protein H7Y37_03845 [Anaerolineae bacterium]|nr:hypothetical protein [Gloeobacterales cyanobacterium ES-bin-313]